MVGSVFVTMTNSENLAMRERDACGIGAVVSIDGVPERSVVDAALKIVASAAAMALAATVADVAQPAAVMFF